MSIWLLICEPVIFLVGYVRVESQSDTEEMFDECHCNKRQMSIFLTSRVFGLGLD